MSLTQAGQTPDKDNFQNLAHSETQKKTVKRLERYAKLLDSQFQIPGTAIRFGWDAVIGLLPGLGDTLTFALSALLILEAKLAGAPLRIIIRMLGNAFVEMVIGIVPIFGDIFDVYWKANVRNIELLKKHLGEIDKPASAKSRRRWLSGFYLFALITLAGAGYLVWIIGEHVLFGA